MQDDHITAVSYIKMTQSWCILKECFFPGDSRESSSLLSNQHSSITDYMRFFFPLDVHLSVIQYKFIMAQFY